METRINDRCVFRNQGRAGGEGGEVEGALWKLKQISCFLKVLLGEEAKKTTPTHPPNKKHTPLW